MEIMGLGSGWCSVRWALSNYVRSFASDNVYLLAQQIKYNRKRYDRTHQSLCTLGEFQFERSSTRRNPVSNSTGVARSNIVDRLHLPPTVARPNKGKVDGNVKSQQATHLVQTKVVPRQT